MELSAAIKHPWVTLEGSVLEDGLDTPDESSGNDVDLEVSRFKFFNALCFAFTATCLLNSRVLAHRLSLSS